MLSPTGPGSTGPSSTGLRSNGLKLLRRILPPGTSRRIRGNLAVVGAFVVVALFLLTRTLIASARIGGDIENAVNPELAQIGADTVRLPVLDRTAEVVQRIAHAAEPLHEDLAATGGSTTDIDDTTRSIVRDVTSIGESIEHTDRSVTAIRLTVERLGLLVTAIHADTGDITADFASTTSRTEDVAAAVAEIATRLGRTADAVAQIDGRVRQTGGSLRSVVTHTENIRDSAVLRLTNVLPPARRTDD